MCLCWKGGWVGMGVGSPCPPIRNDIVTPRHLFTLVGRLWHYPISISPFCPFFPLSPSFSCHSVTLFVRLMSFSHVTRFPIWPCVSFPRFVSLFFPLSLCFYLLPLPCCWVIVHISYLFYQRIRKSSHSLDCFLILCDLVRFVFSVLISYVSCNCNWNQEGRHEQARRYP